MVFTDKALRKFLSDFYMRLALPRILQDIKYMGEELADNSAIATSIDRQKRRASLNLLWPGKNFAENLNMHLELLAKQDIGDIRFSSELESPEEAILTPVLLAAGFTPSMVLPWGGRKGDIAIFRHEGK